ncbi:hypothetical protein DMC01_09925 [Campylobacter troglodytis]|nr:hypothetical protein DMC01_09925 [Campylobacter troglodytis]
MRASATKRGNPLHFVIASEECGNPQSKHIDCHNFAKAKSRNDDTSKLEQEIDKLVYSLYDLNENEIKLIEKA